MEMLFSIRRVPRTIAKWCLESPWSVPFKWKIKVLGWIWSKPKKNKVLILINELRRNRMKRRQKQQCTSGIQTFVKMLELESRAPQEEVVVLLLNQELTKSPLTPDSFACCTGRRGGTAFLMNPPSPFPCCSRDRGRCFHKQALWRHTLTQSKAAVLWRAGLRMLAALHGQTNYKIKIFPSARGGSQQSTGNPKDFTF